MPGLSMCVDFIFFYGPKAHPMCSVAVFAAPARIAPAEVQFGGGTKRRAWDAWLKLPREGPKQTWRLNTRPSLAKLPTLDGPAKNRAGVWQLYSCQPAESKLTTPFCLARFHPLTCFVGMQR